MKSLIEIFLVAVLVWVLYSTFIVTQVLLGWGRRRTESKRLLESWNQHSRERMDA